MLASEALNAAVPKEFWTRVNKNGPAPEHVPHLGRCWEWVGIKGATGYGSYNKVRAHRFILQVALERPLGNLFACHHCDNPSCVNPDHLFAGTHTDNMRDMLSKGRNLNASKTHCRNGHLYTEETTAPRKSRVGRVCLICQRNHHKHYMRRRYAAIKRSGANPVGQVATVADATGTYRKEE